MAALYTHGLRQICVLLNLGEAFESCHNLAEALEQKTAVVLDRRGGRESREMH